ncbi:MAG: DUF2281 domain-containing protein [Chitinophagia bacterium]|nr:DUF2281 domain-containing protein [Chitinophagia bacterium]
MNTAHLFADIESLPDDLKQEVADFVGFLQQKINKYKPTKSILERPFGIGKGSFEMAPDFDAPLEDFNGYR